MSVKPHGTPPWWHGEKAIPAWARLASKLYGALVRLRRGLYRRGWLRTRKVDAPVVVVGNFTAGGSGKTPLAIAIVNRLKQAGWNPGIASRGYGREEAETARWVEAGSDPRTHGDEAVLIARRTGAKVRVDADRVAAARALLEAGCDVIVCDDGLQHLRLARDIAIEVIDGVRRYGNGRLIPAGPLRERPEEAGAPDFRVVNHGIVADLPEAQLGEWPLRQVFGHPFPMQGARARSFADFAGRRVHAIAGIGHPDRFFDLLRAQGLGVVPHPFPDHHAYLPEDLDFGSALPIFMTEKDAVKCAAFAPDDSWCVAIEARLPEAFWLALEDKLALFRSRS
ncbi:tetraacyldisaccharide 4'-kinase [Lysobacter pythonis]|uniref:Tetraacyldisaccharide 4'-kinase n=1 Tax=Solilutibacter pythonis TaxID=2483112 RepID=A0A3M2I4E5_9GAMM|nr:tetraacyldisaccharide 4'-kinase [Lysobacter pythonis]RMH94890.1 tetraacyldisaccharide 4'-kinase [Lysobacter pythonis]